MNEDLAERIRRCPTLPTLPAVAVEVLDLAQRPDADISAIARVITRDPALSGKILKTVNSSFYARSRPVGAVSQAMVILGLQAVKTLVLGFSLVSKLTEGKKDKKSFNHLKYWRRSVYAATSARALAKRAGVVQQEEAFLAALLMDIGMLVLDQVMGDAYGAVEAGVERHDELPAAERAAFQFDHADAAGVLLAGWKLPPVLTTPIIHHHNPDAAADPQLRPLVQLVAVAGRCADVFMQNSTPKSVAFARRACRQQYGLSDGEVDELLGGISKDAKEAATLFEVNLGPNVDIEAVLKRANEALVNLTLEAQLQATTLQRENEDLQRKAVTDGLTGLANRAQFDDFLRERLSAAQRDATPVALVLLDVDHFKSVNDKHGHPAGDAVLQAVSAMVAQAARPQDLAARFGGEELALVLPGVPRRDAAATAELLRRRIAEKPITCDDATIPVTASFGVALFEPGGPLDTPARLLKAADLAVYSAKHAGRNCVRVFTMPATKPAAA